MLFDSGHPFFQKDWALRRHWWRTYHASSSLQKIFEKKDLDQVSLLHVASLFGIVPWVSKLLENGNQALETERSESGYTELQTAVYGGHAPVVKLLLKHNAARSVSDMMIDAVADGDRKMLDFFLRNGANVNHIFDGHSALHMAARRGDAMMVNLLVDRGADIHAENDFGQSALHFAAGYGYDKAVEALLIRGARINSNSRDGCSALHFAAS